MSDRAATPWYHWLISLVGLLVGLFMALDYVMMKTRNAEYLANIPEHALAYFDGLPVWIHALWAIIVWFGLIGWICLVLRVKLASTFFLAAFVALIANMAYWFTTGGYGINDTTGRVFMIVVILSIIIGTWHSRKMRSAGVLN